MEQLVKNLENQIELKDFKLNSLLEITTAINSNQNVETITKLFEFIVHEQLGYERFILFNKQDDKLRELIVSANKIRGILEGENPHLVKNEEKIVKLYTK